MKRYAGTTLGMVLPVVMLSWLLSCSVVMGAEDIDVWEYIEKMAKGEKPGWTPPSIDELTGGKVKIGDLVTAENVDLVKEYLAPCIYEAVKKGMVLKMAKQLPPESTAPQHEWQATFKNKGKATMKQNAVVYMPDGSPWDGGLPYVLPQNGLEAMRNNTYGTGWDDMHNTNQRVMVDKHGEIEKIQLGEVWSVQGIGRTKIPPTGYVPGYEGEQNRLCTLQKSPYQIKGMGMVSIRAYDSTAYPDKGFMYMPAFKRVVRVSAASWQDNQGGGDLTMGDMGGLREPYANWEFKGFEKRLVLAPTPNSGTTPESAKKARDAIEWDVGYTFPRVDWAPMPVFVIEGYPTIEHIYSKKVFYMLAAPYTATIGQFPFMDIYDRQGKLWKMVCQPYTSKTMPDGITYGAILLATIAYDLQSPHATTLISVPLLNVEHVKTEDLNLQFLLKRGK